MKKHLTTIAVALLSCSLQAKSEPLKEFETLVAACKSSMEGRPSIKVNYNESSGIWLKILFGPAVVTYDVVKTNSLVSPFSAVIEVTEIISSKTDKDESTLRAAPIAIDESSTFPTKYVTKITYDYKANSWEATGAVRTTFARRQGGMQGFEGQGSSFRHTRENLPKALSTLVACLPKTV